MLQEENEDFNRVIKVVTHLLISIMCTDSHRLELYALTEAAQSFINETSK